MWYAVRMGTRKRERCQLAKAELLLQLAVTAQRWTDELRDKNGGLPVAEWPADDPFITLCRTYRLDPADLGAVAEQIADELEQRAIRAGYDRGWEPED